MALRIAPAVTLQDFATLHALRQRVRLWDIDMTGATGSPQALAGLDAIYSADPADLQRSYTAPGAGMLLAWDEATPLGSAGYGPVDAGLAEIEKFYVAEEARGRGLGALLLTEVLTCLRAEGYRRVVLETASFMTAAHRLYRKAGFTDCPPFRPALDELSLFFGRDL